MQESLKNHRLTLFLLFVCAAAAFFWGLGGCGLFDTDEAVYSEVSREMSVSGDYTVPYFNGQPFLEKPAMLYWAQALMFKVLGPSAAAARFPSAAASLILIIVFYYLCRMVFGPDTALISSAALAFNVEMGILSKTAATDALLLLFITVSIMCFLAGKSTGRSVFYYGFYACAAAAGLVKGPVGFIVPFGVVLLSAVISGRPRDLAEAKPLTGLLLFLLILVPWYAAVSVRTNGDFIGEFFLKHNFARFGKPFEGHSGGIFYYIPVILFGFFPWSAFLVQAAADLKFKDWKNVYLAVWALLPFLAFSVSGTKLPNYILPVFAPLAIICGLWLEKYINGERGAALSAGILVFLAGMFCALLFFADPMIKAAQARFDNPFLRQDISLGAGTRIFAVIFFALVAGSAALTAVKYRKWFVFSAVSAGLLFNVFTAGYLVPKGWNYAQGGLHSLSLEAGKYASSELIVFGIYNPSINFYSEKTARIIPKEKPEELKRTVKELQKEDKNFIIIADDSLSGSLPGALTAVKSAPGYALYRSAGAREDAAPAYGGRWKGFYGFLRYTDLKFFFIVNDYPGSPLLDYTMMFFTTLGNGFLLLPVVAAVLYLHDRKRFTFNLIFFLIVVCAGGLLVQILKFIINSPRPLKRLNEVRVLLDPLREHGFPSGHTQAAFSAAFFLSTRIKKWAVVFFGCALLVGYSRIYVGAHFPSDVFAGACVGIVSAGLLIIFFEEKLKSKFEKNL